jgi:hypothetical protein
MSLLFFFFFLIDSLLFLLLGVYSWERISKSCRAFIVVSFFFPSYASFSPKRFGTETGGPSGMEGMGETGI